jgi:PAS domain S-box-containing protein
MAGHDIILITLGLTIAIGIIWRVRFVGEIPFSFNLPDIVISLYLIASGGLSISQSFGYLQFLNDKPPATLLLFMPAALSATRLKTALRGNPSTTLWLAVGLALAGYSTLLNSKWSPAGLSPDSPSLFASLFLFISMLFFRRYQRFLLGLSTVVWVINLTQIASMGSSGIGIIMGAISFSSIISFVHTPGMNQFDFDLRDFIKSLANPCLILNLDGKAAYCNEPFMGLSGRSKDSILGVDAIDMFDIPLDWRFRLGPSERFKKVRCYLLTVDNERIPIQLALSEIRNAHGELKSLLCEVFEERERDILESRLKNESMRFASFYETSQALSSSLELKDVLRSIARAAESLTRADSCTICTVDQSCRILRPVYSSEAEFNAEVMNFEITVGSGLTGSVVADGKPRIQNFDDASQVAVHIPGTTDEEEESLMSTPLIVKDSVIGALTLYKIGRRRFEQDDLKILTVFASQAAAIIESSRLYMKLKASERLYRYSVDLAGDAILFVDFESGKITDANEMALKLFKYSRAEFLTMRIWELNPESQMQVTNQLWEEVRQTGWGKLGEVEYILKDSSKIPASVNVSVIYAGEVNSIQWMIRDISEYKRNIEKAGFFHQLFERLEEPVMLTNNRGKILYSNRAFRDAFDLGSDEVTRGDVASIDLQGSHLDPLTSCWAKLRGKSYLIDEIKIANDKGSTIRKVVSILPCRNTHGEIKYYAWLFHPPIDVVSAEEPVKSTTCKIQIDSSQAMSID